MRNSKDGMPTDMNIEIKIKSLEEDIKLLLRFSDAARSEIEFLASGAGGPTIDPALREECRSFLEKYGFGL
jgi:hypothetical protein